MFAVSANTTLTMKAFEPIQGHISRLTQKAFNVNRRQLNNDQKRQSGGEWNFLKTVFLLRQDVVVPLFVISAVEFTLC